MAVNVSKERPEWLAKIEKDHFKAQNKAFEAWLKFCAAVIAFEEEIECINVKFKSDYSIENLFDVTEEHKEQAIDMLGLDDSDDDDDDDDDDEKENDK